jgi:hypothetical protein
MLWCLVKLLAYRVVVVRFLCYLKSAFSNTRGTTAVDCLTGLMVRLLDVNGVQAVEAALRRALEIHANKVVESKK